MFIPKLNNALSYCKRSENSMMGKNAIYGNKRNPLPRERYGFANMLGSVRSRAQDGQAKYCK